MDYYLIQPEVAGQLGDKSRLRYENGRIKEVLFLEYKMYGWQGDELLRTHPCLIVTESLRNDILKQKLTGVKFRKMLLTVSEEFYELYGDVKFPNFVEMICENSYEKNLNSLKYDFYYNEYKQLIVSEKALDVIKQHKIDMSVIEKI